jgi:hypothetical protein
VRNVGFKKTILVKQASLRLFELPETGREAPVLPTQKYYLKIYISQYEEYNPMKQESTNCYSAMMLREQIYLECRVMAEYALSKGMKTPTCAIKTIDSFEYSAANELSSDGNPKSATDFIINRDMDLDELINVHALLCKIIEPAMPQTLLLYKQNKNKPSLFKFLGPVPLMRQMLLISISSLTFFVIAHFTPYIDISSNGNLQDLTGMSLIVNFLYFLCASSLGACFLNLYEISNYITKGSYDPTYSPFYWLRFFLGLISGMILAVSISHEAFQGIDYIQLSMLRPTLALVGGFSADLFYTLLNRFVESLKTVFQGGAHTAIQAKKEAVTAAADSKINFTQMQLTAELVKLMQEVNSSTNPDEIRQKLNKLIEENLTRR